MFDDDLSLEQQANQEWAETAAQLGDSLDPSAEATPEAQAQFTASEAAPASVAAFSGGDAEAAQYEGISGASQQYGERPSPADVIAAGGVPFADAPSSFGGDDLEYRDGKFDPAYGERIGQATVEALEPPGRSLDTLEGLPGLGRAPGLPGAVAEGAGQFAGLVGRGIEWTDRNIGDPIWGHAANAGQWAADQFNQAMREGREAMARPGGPPARDDWRNPQDPRLLNRSGPGERDVYQSDPVYQQLQRENPAAAARYAQTVYPSGIPGLTMAQQIASNPVNFIGPGALSTPLRGGVRAAAAHGAPGLARGLERAAGAVEAVETAANLPMEVIQRGIPLVGRALSGAVKPVTDVAGEVIGYGGRGPLARSPQSQSAAAAARMGGLERVEQQAPDLLGQVMQGAPGQRPAAVSSVAEQIRNGQVPTAPSANGVVGQAVPPPNGAVAQAPAAPRPAVDPTQPPPSPLTGRPAQPTAHVPAEAMPEPREAGWFVQRVRAASGGRVGAGQLSAEQELSLMQDAWARFGQPASAFQHQRWTEFYEQIPRLGMAARQELYDRTREEIDKVWQGALTDALAHVRGGRPMAGGAGLSRGDLAAIIREGSAADAYGGTPTRVVPERVLGLQAERAIVEQELRAAGGRPHPGTREYFGRGGPWAERLRGALGGRSEFRDPPVSGPPETPPEAYGRLVEGLPPSHPSSFPAYEGDAWAQGAAAARSLPESLGQRLITQALGGLDSRGAAAALSVPERQALAEAFAGFERLRGAPLTDVDRVRLVREAHGVPLGLDEVGERERDAWGVAFRQGRGQGLGLEEAARRAQAGGPQGPPEPPVRPGPLAAPTRSFSEVEAAARAPGRRGAPAAAAAPQVAANTPAAPAMASVVRGAPGHQPAAQSLTSGQELRLQELAHRELGVVRTPEALRERVFELALSGRASSQVLAALSPAEQQALRTAFAATQQLAGMPTSGPSATTQATRWVRDSFGIPSQMTVDGIRDFQAYRTAYQAARARGASFDDAVREAAASVGARLPREELEAAVSAGHQFAGRDVWERATGRAATSPPAAAAAPQAAPNGPVAPGTAQATQAAPAPATNGLVQAARAEAPEQATTGVAQTLETLPGFQNLAPELQSVVRSLAGSPAAREAWQTAVRRNEDPRTAAMAAYLREVEKEVLKYEPKLLEQRNVVYQAVARFMNEWTSMALMLPAFHVGNFLNQVSNAALEGMSPYVGGFQRRMSKFGLDRVPAEWTVTMGARGVEHEQQAAQLMSNPGLRSTVEQVSQAFRDHALRPEKPGTWSLPGQPLERTYGTAKAVNEAVIGAMESAARDGIGYQALERVMNREWQGVTRQLSGLLQREGMDKRAAEQLSVGLYNLEKWTPTAVAEHLRSQGVAQPIVDVMQRRVSEALERGVAAGQKQISRVHANYAERTNLEANIATRVIYPFTKWALNNVRFYAEALVSRPALWAVLSRYQEISEQDNELGEGRPERLNRFVELGGQPGQLIAAALFGDPNVHVFVNPLERTLTVPGQRQAYTGRGANETARSVAEASALAGISFGPIPQLVMQTYGLLGDVPVNTPLSSRTVPGMLAQGAYGTATGGRNLEADFSRTMRNVAPPGGQSLESQYPSISGAGPVHDASINREITQQAVQQGLEPQRSGEVMLSRHDPQSARYQAAEATVNARATNPAQQTLQGVLGARPVQPVDYAIRQSQEELNRLEQRGVPFETAVKRAEAGGPVPAEWGWHQNSIREQLELDARQQALQMGVKRAPIEQEIGQTRPTYPGPGASREEREGYFDQVAAYQQPYAAAGQRALDRGQAAQQGLAAAQGQVADMRQTGQPFADLTQQGLGPWSDQWTQAREQFQGQQRQILDNAWTALRQANAGTYLMGDVQGPGIGVNELDVLELDPQRRRAAELRGYLETLPPETRGQAYYGPEFAELREYDARNRPEAQRAPEARWQERANQYQAVWDAYHELRTSGDADGAAAIYAEARQRFPGGDGLPGWEEYAVRGQTPQERMQRAVADAFHKVYQGYQLGTGERSGLYNADPVVTRVAFAGSVPRPGRSTIDELTPEEIEYAAKRLGVTITGQTVAPAGQARTPVRDDYSHAAVPGWTGGPYDPTTMGPRTISTPERQAQIERGAVTQAQPAPAAVRSTLEQMTQQGVAARQASRAGRGGGGITNFGNEPFQGSTLRQQLGSTGRYIANLAETRGEAAAAKWIYENYERYKALRDQAGETTPHQSVYGRRALELSSRPGSFGTMSLSQGIGRFQEMAGVLRALVGKDFDRAAVIENWQQRFGERLRPEDLTPDAIQAKLQWTYAQLQQADRYRETPEGQREVIERDTARRQAEQLSQQRDQLLEQLRGVRARASGFGKRYGELKAAGDRAGASQFYNSTRGEQERALAEAERLSREYEAAKRRSDEAWNQYNSKFARTRAA